MQDVHSPRTPKSQTQQTAREVSRRGATPGMLG